MTLREEVRERVERLEIPFGSFGVDPYGISKRHLEGWFFALGVMYRDYFRVRSHGIHHVPPRGRAMLVGNHSGGIALDGAMVIASMFFDMDPPRLAQGMVEKFMGRLPFMGELASRIGQFTGLPEHCVRLLEDDRMLMVFPEGARGTAKLYWQRTSLVHFGSGFVRLALATKTPIVPLAFIGGGDAFPTVFNAKKLGRLFGVPYLPITPYLLPLPLPVPLAVHYGEPIHFDGTGNEDDRTIELQVHAVKQRVAELIEHGERARRANDGPILPSGAR